MICRIYRETARKPRSTDGRYWCWRQSSPSGWSVASISNDTGVWRGSSREWLWFQLADGATRSPSVTLSVPNDTAPGAYEVAATARVDDFAAAASANVTVTERGASIAPAIAGSDGRIGTVEMLQAIGYWANGQAVPGTGRTISTTKLLELIDLWSRGAAV